MLLPAVVLAIFTPLAFVIVLSVVIGFGMVVLFRYTSDQKAIHVAKDQLKAHLLAVRLFQDQLPVVVRSYGRIIRGTVRYLRLAFMPLLLVILPLTALIVELDRYLGGLPIAPGANFLLRARADAGTDLDQISLRVPDGISESAPAVHIPKENEVVWRLQAHQAGAYDIEVVSPGQTASKHVVVSKTVARLSPARTQAAWWKRFFSSAEPALAKGPLDAVEVNYPERSIGFAWIEWNWIVLFFILSLVAGFIFKTMLGIEI